MNSSKKINSKKTKRKTVNSANKTSELGRNLIKGIKKSSYSDIFREKLKYVSPDIGLSHNKDGSYSNFYKDGLKINPEEIDKAREERGLAKPEVNTTEKSGASGEYQGSYHGNPELKSEPAPKKPSNNETSTQKTGKSGKGHKGHKGGKKHHVVQFPSQMTQAQTAKAERAVEEEVA